MTSEQIVNILKAQGGNLWEKARMSRVYFNTPALCRIYGLELDFYKSGNVSHATLDGEKISNSRGRKEYDHLEQCKFWYDVNDDKFRSRYLNEEVYDVIATRLRELLSGTKTPPGPEE